MSKTALDRHKRLEKILNKCKLGELRMENSKQIQKAGENSQQIQAQTMIVNQGISEERVRIIFSEMLAIDLLAKVKSKIAELDHWTEKQESKAVIDNLIRDTLWAELPESYSEDSISAHRQKIYEYIYTRYPEVA